MIDPATLLDGMYRAEAGNLTRYFNNRLKGDDEPSDYVQEVFTRLAGHLSGTAIGQPYRYLRRIARNLLFERSRRLRTRTTFNHVPLSPALEPAVPAEQTDHLDLEETLVVCNRLLDELPAKTREVFLLYRVEELSYKEIGVRLGITTATVQYHFGRALAHLDATLGQK